MSSEVLAVLFADEFNLFDVLQAQGDAGLLIVCQA
jgi:hypothetical protein